MLVRSGRLGICSPLNPGSRFHGRIGMRRIDLEIIDLQEIENVISEAKFCRIAMVDEGIPYVVPMCFGYDDGRLFLHSAVTGRKLDVMRRNPLVCFEITAEAEVLLPASADGGGVRYRSVIGTGTARVVENSDEKMHALAVLSRHYFLHDIEIPVAAARKTVAIEVRIDSMTGKRSEG
jgi:uncharacterized protein